LGKIKYIKDNEDDCDLDPEQLVYDLLIDEGKAANDGSDQHVTIKFIQEQGGALRSGSVIPDLTSIHYLPRPRPPIPKFPTQPVLGKRAGTYGSHDSSENRFEVKRQRVTEASKTEVDGEDDPVDSIETDVSDLKNDQEEAGRSPDLIQNSQMPCDSAHHSSRPSRPPLSSNIFAEHPHAGSVSRQSSQSSKSFSPALDQDNTEDELARFQHFIPSANRYLTNGLSQPKPFALNQNLEASKTLVSPSSDEPNEFSAGSKGLSRASSASSRKFKNHNFGGVASDIDDSQMSPRSKMTMQLPVKDVSASKETQVNMSQSVEKTQHLTKTPRRRDTNSSVDNQEPPSQQSIAPRRWRRNLKKSAVDDLSLLDSSQTKQQDVSKAKFLITPQAALNQANQTTPQSLALDWPKPMTDSSRDTPAIDSPGEQLSEELLASARKPILAQDSQIMKDKIKPKPEPRKKLSLLKVVEPPGKGISEAATTKAAANASKTAPNSKPKKLPAKEQKGSKAANKPKTAKTGKNDTANTSSNAKENVAIIASSLPEGSMSLDSTDNLHKDKNKSLAAKDSSPELPTLSNAAKQNPTPIVKAKRATPAEKKNPAATKSKVAAVETSDINSDSGPTVLPAKGSTDAASTKAPLPFQTSAVVANIEYTPVVPKGWTQEMYQNRKQYLKTNPIPTKEEKPKKEKTPKGLKADSAEKGNPEKISSARSSVQKFELSAVAIKATGKGRSTPPSETLSTTNPKGKVLLVASPSGKSLSTNFTTNTSERGVSVESSSHADILARAEATIKKFKSSSDKQTSPVTKPEVQSSWLKPTAAPTPPASVTTNPNLKRLREEINVTQQKVDYAKSQKPAVAKNSIALLEAEADEDESSESESDDDDGPVNKKATALSSAVPDPSTRDQTPSSDEDDDDEEEEEEF
jgi:hypothetical protein